MLAGCSSSLLSSRHHHQLRSDSSAVQLQEKHCSLHQKMGTQRFDLPCAFSKRDNPRVALSLDTAGDARSTTSCSFRQSNPVGPPSSQSLVAQAAPPWGAKIEADDNCLIWDRSRTSKRYRERVEEGEEEEETYLVRAKRTRTRTRSRTVVGTNQFVAGGDDLWFPQSIERPPLVEEEEEEKVFLVPNAASFPFLASSSNNTLVVGSFETERDLDNNNNNNNNNSKSQSDSSSSSGTNGFSSSKPEIDPETAGCGVHYSSAISEVGGGSQGRHHSTEQGVELVDLLTSCAEAISYGNHEGVNYFLSRLGEQASPTAATPIHRVVAYFTEALALRVAKLWPHIFTITTPPRSRGELLDDDDGDASALRLLNHVSPIPKFLHFTLNERLLREFQGKDRVHIIDFDIKQGLQWPSLFQSLASRPNPPSHVRITGVGESRQDLQDTGVRLARLAEALNLPFEFHAVADRLEDVRLWMLHVKRDECVAVNCVLVMHKALSDEDSGGGGGASMTDFLGLIRSTKPSILVMAEQEADHNKQSWEMRFANSLQYYSALFDSVHYSCLPEDSQARIKVEEMFAREIRNLVVCQGSDRFERHQSFNKWTQLLEDGGFRSSGAIGEREITHSRMILRMYSSSSNNYSVEKVGEGSDGLTLKWLDQPLYTVSAWTPTDVAGSSSTSQPS